VTAILALSAQSFALEITVSQLLDRAESLGSELAYDSALEYSKLGVRESVKLFGERDTTTAMALRLQAKYEEILCQVDSCWLHAQQALDIQLASADTLRPEVSRALYQYASASITRIADLDSTARLLDRTLALQENVLGRENAELAETLMQMARVRAALGKYSEQRPLFERALDIWKVNYGERSCKAARGIAALGSIDYRLGDYRAADSSYRQALRLAESECGDFHPEVARILNTMGVLYESRGMHAEAMRAYLRAIEIREKIFGPNHGLVGQTLINLAGTYRTLRQFEKSATTLHRGIAIDEELYGKEGYGLSVNYLSLAESYAEMGEYLKAESTYAFVLAMQKRLMGATHPHVAYSLSGLARVSEQQGDYEDAIHLTQEALRVTRVTYDEHSPNVGFVLLNNARLSRLTGDSRGADSVVSLAYSMLLSALGTDNLYVASALEEMSKIDRVRLRQSTAIEHASMALLGKYHCFGAVSEILTESDALQFDQHVLSSLDNYLSCYLDLDLPGKSHTRECADMIASAKGLVLDRYIDRQKNLLSTEDALTVNLLDSLRDLRQEFVNTFTRLVPVPHRSLSTRMDSLRKEISRLEESLTSQDSLYSKNRSVYTVSCTEILRKLPDSMAIVEYYSFNQISASTRSQTERYLGVVLRTGREPIVIPLGSASVIDSLVDELQSHMQEMSNLGHLPTQHNKLEYVKIARALYELVVKPIESSIVDSRLLLIAPDGDLNLLPFEALMDSGNRYFIERMAIHYLGAARDVIRLNQVHRKGRVLLGFADPDYDSRANSATPYSQAKFSNTRANCTGLYELKVGRLPNTLAEVDSISTVWAALESDSIEIYEGIGATEQVFKARCADSKVIHLATHGFDLSSVCGKSTNSKNPAYQVFGELNPLLLSGVLLAGCNADARVADGTGAEDGILSAYEVSQLDLSGTDLIVLSACESGLGQPRRAEGVFGLRRAFQLAGARTIVSALWPVPDQSTATLMQGFYSAPEKSFSARLRSALLSRLKWLRDQKLADHPYSWAAFIAVGDWR
jgi:CHAT domain-containing protein/tetratricopeptide (TPR) repeat protein